MINTDVSGYAEVNEIEFKHDLYGNTLADVRLLVPIRDSAIRGIDERELADEIEDAVSKMLRNNGLA